MTFASSSLVTLTMIEEATFGVTPASGNPITVRVTGETLDFAITKEMSKEINSSRTNSSTTPVSANTSGGITAEMHYAGLDVPLQAVMQSTYAVFGTNGVGTAVAVNITTTTITATVAPTGANAFTNLKLGQWFSIVSAGANNGKVLRVSTVTAPTTTVITLDAGTPGVAATGESVQITSSRLTHGNTQKSYSIQRQHADNGVFTVFRGETFSKLSLAVASGSLSTISFDLMGKDADSNTTTFMPGTATDPVGYEVHSGVSGAMKQIWMNGAPLSGTYVKSATLDFDNSLRSQEALGTLGAVGIGNGTIAATLTAQIYFQDKAMFDRYKNNTNVSWILPSVDEAGNGYIFTMPKANVTTYKTNASAKDQDMMLDVTFNLLEDRSNAVAALRKVLFIDRIGAAVV